MDPLTQGLLFIVLLSFVVERALAVIFDSDRLKGFFKAWDLKPWVAIAVSIAVCAGINLDILAILRASAHESLKLTPMPGWLGIVLTGLTVAGGSAGSVKLFQDVLGFRRSSREQIRLLAEEEQKAALAEAEARKIKADSDKVVAEVAKQTAILHALAPAPGIALDDAKMERDFANRFFEIAAGVKSERKT